MNKPKTGWDEACVAVWIDTLQKKVDAMPLSTWLYAIKRSIPHIGKDHAMREFVDGMHKRGLMYHWDDCANDCLRGKVNKTEGDLINEIVGILHREDMFVMSMQLIEEQEYEQRAKEIAPEIEKIQAEYIKKHCICDIKDLATWGCKCGGV